MTVFTRRYAGMTSEQLSEITWAGIANLKGDVQDAEVGFQKQLPRRFHPQMNKYWDGLRPVAFLNRRLKCETLMPASDASLSRLNALPIPVCRVAMALWSL